MKYTATITVKPEDEHRESLIRTLLVREIKDKTHAKLTEKDITTLVQVKKSLDARRGTVKLHLRYDVYTDGDKPETADAGAPFEPKWQQADGAKGSAIIIGDGPAGIFAALTLLESGIKPIIVERGAETSERKRIIADISRRGAVDTNTNYCFGEGGAGTFSDGKLFSRSNKRGNIPHALQLFHYHGATEDILTNAHPHIGTDKLPVIINNMNATIRQYGGEILFNTCCTGFVTEGDRITGVRVAPTNKCSPAAPASHTAELAPATQDTLSETTIAADAVILATGHSAPDIYHLVAAVNPAALEAKTFAAGVRVEHPRTIIDAIQYHGKPAGGALPPAEYRLTAQADGRGVYSFCMCPGGLVVPSASSPDGIVVNGMSPSSRGGRWSNAAIVVEIRPEDVPAEYRTCKNDPLAGLRFRTALEQSCAPHTAKGNLAPTNAEDAQTSAPEATTPPHNLANPQMAPAQRLVDFLNGCDSTTLPDTTYAPGVFPARLDRLLPEHIARRLKEGFTVFGNQMKGFICDEALLIAPETRTSTPVRILRDKETWESPVLKGLYPAGEGSGYAGGITSSALDGENAARAAAKAILAKRK